MKRRTQNLEVGHRLSICKLSLQKHHFIKFYEIYDGRTVIAPFIKRSSTNKSVTSDFLLFINPTTVKH